jgi:hypothetical protein
MQSSISITSAYSTQPSCRQQDTQASPVHPPSLHPADDTRSACGLPGTAEEPATAASHGALHKPCAARLRHRAREIAMPEQLAAQLARAKKLLAHGLHVEAAPRLFMAWCRLLAPLLADFIIALEAGKLAADVKRKMLLMLLCAVIACEPLRQLAYPSEFADRHACLATQQARALLEALEHCRRNLSQSLAGNPDDAACPPDAGMADPLPDWLGGLWLQLMACQAP